MRVLYVDHTALISGGELAMVELAAELTPDVAPILACPAGPLADHAREAGIRVETVPAAEGSLRLHPLRTPAAALQLARLGLAIRRIAARNRIDLVHAGSIRAGLAAALARRLGAPPGVVVVQDRLPRGLASRAILETLARGSAVLLPNSRYTAESLPPIPGRIQVVHLAVDTRRFDPSEIDRREARERLGIPDGPPVLALIAQITQWKGQDLALRALAELRERAVDALLLLAGSVVFNSPHTRFDNLAYERQLHQLVADLGLHDRVRFLGQREDMPHILAASDLVLVPSAGEPFGRSVIEAMAMGVPVVAAAQGGPAEIISNDDEGVLVDDRDPRRWADELASLIGDGRRREEIAAAGRRRARDFNLERHVAAVRAVYERVLGA